MTAGRRSRGPQQSRRHSFGERVFERLGRLIRKARSDPARQLRVAVLMLVVLVVAGTAGYGFIENLPFLDALYMTVITLTTVGFGEVHPLSETGRVFTIAIIIMGVGISAWAVSSAAEVMLGEAFWISFQRRRIREQVMDLHDHYVVCGYGRLGRQIVRDLQLRGEPFVVIDSNHEIEEELLEERLPHIIGDATRDETLEDAAVARARGLVACLDSDANNVLTVLTARGLSARLLIVARANTEAAESKLRRAGADRMVTPEAIGGHRLALALLRPAVHDFFTRVFSLGTDTDVDIGQLTIPAKSPFDGQTIAKCDLRRVRNVSILAIRSETAGFDLNPPPDRLIRTGETLILIGPAEAIYELEAMYGSEPG